MHSVKEYCADEHIEKKGERKSDNEYDEDEFIFIRSKQSNRIIEETEKEKKGSKKRLKKKLTFTLKDIEPTEVDRKYNIAVTPNLQQTHIPKNVTVIDQLYPLQKQAYFIPFIDESRKHCVTMIDSITKKSIQAYYCFWCRHSFSTIPIGCPIRYINNKVVQMHISEITKEKYFIVNQVTENAKIDHLKNTKMIHNNYYETDGCFCSFNCCLAFIHDNTHNSLYMNSKHLLMKMYSEIFKTEKLKKIFPAPNWRLLKPYGGFMDIIEFRDSFANYIYIDNNHAISKLPKIMPIGHVFEEHIIF